MVCKINLDGMSPPLNLRVMVPEKERKNNNLTVFASYKCNEPSAEKHEMSWVPLKRQIINIAGEKGPKPNIKVFPGNIIYFTFISQKGATIVVKPNFSDSGMMKPGHKDGQGGAGGQPSRPEFISNLDDPRSLPAQKNMIYDFTNYNLNFRDTMMMIEETRKKDNENFGMNIVRAA